MKWSSLNPVNIVSGGINKALNKVIDDLDEQHDNQDSQETAPESTLPAPAPAAPGVTIIPEDSQGKPGVPVQGQFIARGEQDARMLSIVTAAAQRTEQFRREAENFDDEKAAWGEKILRFIFAMFAYVAPSLLAIVVGLAVGDARSE